VIARELALEVTPTVILVVVCSLVLYGIGVGLYVRGWHAGRAALLRERQQIPPQAYTITDRGRRKDDAS
jgi:hypothetical protein